MKYKPKKQACIVNDFYDDSTYIIYTPTYKNIPFLPTGAGYFFAGEEYYVERDNLNMHLMLMTIKGSGTITYRNKTILLLPGQAILINGNEYNMYRTTPNQHKWTFKWVRFQSKYFYHYDRLINNDSFYPMSVINTNFEEKCDTFIQYIKGEESLKDILLSNLLSSMLTILFEQASFDPIIQFREKYEAIENTRKYICTHFDQRINIDNLAELCNMNKFAFIRKFKNYLGMTPYSYIQKERINQAIILLETTSIPIGDISDSVGFTNQNNFTKQFKSFMGLTPTQYRKQ